MTSRRKGNEQRQQLYRLALLFSVALGGFLSLAVELSLSRLLRPWFGDMLFIWAGIIGFVLLYLALGNVIGGRWSTRTDDRKLPPVFVMAGLGIFLLPPLSRPLLVLAQQGMRAYNVALPAAALAVIFILLAVPLTLLGTISPLVVRLLTTRPEESGRVAGWVFGVGTGSSLIGAFLPVFILLPRLGTRATFALLGALAITWGVILWLVQGRGGRTWGAFLLFLLLTLVYKPVITAPIKGVTPRGRILYEVESPYSFIQVVEWQGERWLKLNEGEGIHSVWRPETGLSEGIWDYFLLAPYFVPEARARPPKSLLVIGLAGGTVPTLYARAFGPLKMVGVELDPAVIEVAYRYFGLADIPSLQAIALDGRVYLVLNDHRFDIIAVDAYRPPYIPFHLTTLEFFREVKEHLTPLGIVAVNAARTQDDLSLVYALSSTMQQVFPSVFIIDEPLGEAAWGNSLVVGTNQPTTLNDFWVNVGRESNPYVREMARRVKGRVRVAPPPSVVLYDDRAPVEQIVHSIMMRYFLSR